MPPKKKKQKPIAKRAISSEKYVFFYVTAIGHGYLAQWYRSSFTVTADSLSYLRRAENEVFSLEPTITFNTAEQYMMFAKAFYFNDMEIAVEIMEATYPRAQKSLGRSVKGFTDDEWCLVREQVVEEGNWAKFTQNEELGRRLLSTGDKTLVEASKHDRVWGIGFCEKDARQHLDEFKWGMNLLGQGLMRVRDRMKMAGENL
jgi:ribA/ribD-fused uncharacterized protein